MFSTSSLQFTALQANQDGTCGNTVRSSIVFGENLQSICQLKWEISMKKNHRFDQWIRWISSSATCPTTAELGTNFLGTILTNIYIGTYGNSDVANFNSDQWKQVTTCTSEIGSSDVPVCQTGLVPTVTANQCYVRLDIQIAYANIGAVANPQSVIGAVVFHYQRIVSKKKYFSLVRFIIMFLFPVSNGNGNGHFTDSTHPNCYLSRFVQCSDNSRRSFTESEHKNSWRFFLSVLVESRIKFIFVLLLFHSIDPSYSSTLFRLNSVNK